MELVWHNRILEDEPRKGYYWGKWSNPVDFAYACFNIARTGVDDIKVIMQMDGPIKDIIEW